MPEGTQQSLDSLQPLLVVDDDETFANVLLRALNRRGYTALCATSFQQALTYAAEKKPGAAIVDLNLGEHTGLQLIPELVALCPDIRILVLTGYSSIATTVEAIKLGAVNYLCKPASLDELIAALLENPANPNREIAGQPTPIERLEWEHIQRVLRENNNNVSATARALGMHRRTLQRKLGKRPVAEQLKHRDEDKGPQSKG